ncbi:MAG TPA: hypothetical protein VG943_18760 [Caulobacterales bacterium]|nr:hypothetical protein [Caulobacterales bacterium]
MKRYWMFAPLLALLACGQPQATAEKSATSAQAQDACVAQATRNWPIGGQTFRVDASAHGPSCSMAEATLIIRAPDGAVLFSKTYAISQISLSFNPNGDQGTLNDDLNSWIENQAPGANASSLPAWPAGAEKPPQFQPAATRDVYEGARTAQRPLFCYPDDGESHACVAVDATAHSAVLLGSRLFERD